MHAALRSSASPCANPHVSPKWQLPLIMKRRHNFDLWLGKCFSSKSTPPREVAAPPLASAPRSRGGERSRCGERSRGAGSKDGWFGGRASSGSTPRCRSCSRSSSEVL